jgi:hypothetical protein
MSLAGNAALVGNGPTLPVIVRWAGAIRPVSAVTAPKAGVSGRMSAVTALKVGAIRLTRAVIVTKTHRPDANTVTGAAS